MKFTDLKTGQTARITALGKGEKVYRQRLIALGLLPGTEFKVARLAPLGDPIEIEIRGFSLSLRKDEASMIQIEPV